MFKSVLSLVKGSLDESMEWMKESWVRRCRASLLQALACNLTLPGSQFAAWGDACPPRAPPESAPRVSLTLPPALQQWLRVRGVAPGDVVLFDSAVFLHVGNASGSTFRIRHDRTVVVFDRASLDVLVVLSEVEARVHLQKPELTALPFPFLGTGEPTETDAAAAAPAAASSATRGSDAAAAGAYHLEDDNNLETARRQSHALQMALVNAAVVRHVYQYEFARLTMAVAARQARHALSGDHPVLPLVLELEGRLHTPFERGVKWSGLRHVVFASGAHKPSDLLQAHITQRDDVLLAVLARDPGTYLAPQRPLFGRASSSSSSSSNSSGGAVAARFFSAAGVPGFCAPALVRNPYYHDVQLGFRRRVHAEVQAHVDAMGMSTRHNIELARWADVALQKLRLRVPRAAQFAAHPLLEELAHQCVAVQHGAEWAFHFDDTLPRASGLWNVLDSWRDGLNAIRASDGGPAVADATDARPRHFASPVHLTQLLAQRRAARSDPSQAQAQAQDAAKQRASPLWAALASALHRHLADNRALRVQGDEWVAFL